MFVLVGLGNPGSEYQNTRHNAGFLLLDSLSQEFNLPISQTKFNAQVGRGLIENHDVLLVKPQTYMNLSGKSVQQVLAYFKVPVSQLLVISDDLDLPHGQVKTRFGGGHGGHKGLESILSSLATDKFHRIKIGIGKPAYKSATSDWVLDAFSKTEMQTLVENSFPLATQRIIKIMADA